MIAALRAWWERRGIEALVVGTIALALLGLVAGYWRSVRTCERLYARATSAADSARVDDSHPGGLNTQSCAGLVAR